MALPLNKNEFRLFQAPGGAVEGTVGDGFGDMGSGDFGGAVEVGDSTCHLQDAVVGACAHIIFEHYPFQD